MTCSNGIYIWYIYYLETRLLLLLLSLLLLLLNQEQKYCIYFHYFEFHVFTLRSSDEYKSYTNFY